MEYVKQTGLLYRFDPNDYRVGASPLVVPSINPSGDWRDWEPTEEKQYRQFTFDTMACATFAGNNVVEPTIEFLIEEKKLAQWQIDWLKDNGYLIDGKINLSDRFTAIMSGTTKQGNYMQNVWDSLRNHGAIPEKDFAFDGNTWEQYHNKALITDAMKKKALKFLDIFESSYEWAVNTPADLKIALQQCPLEIAIYEGSHAVALLKHDYIFDTYPPFLQKWDKPITYALKGFVRVKVRTIKLGMKGEDVKQLQTALKALGYAVGVIDGWCGQLTVSAIKAFQKANGLVADGLAGKNTQAVLYAPKKKPKIDLSKWALLPELDAKAVDFLTACADKGYDLKITQGYRTAEYQDELYSHGRNGDKRPIVTYATSKNSKHCFGKAFDIAFNGSDPYPAKAQWDKIGAIGKSLGLKWGGDFTGKKKDMLHFEILE